MKSVGTSAAAMAWSLRVFAMSREGLRVSTPTEMTTRSGGDLDFGVARDGEAVVDGLGEERQGQKEKCDSHGDRLLDHDKKICVARLLPF
ncbi:MAG: hypothetical protein NTV52_21220 [Acidobacteria bacterium]|nr:hypothetical protein [Acidobacteriota bacterium]